MRAYDTSLRDLWGIMSWKRYEADETTALLCLGLLIQLKEERAWSEIVLREENIPTSWNSFVFFFPEAVRVGPQEEQLQYCYLMKISDLDLS